MKVENQDNVNKVSAADGAALPAHECLESWQTYARQRQADALARLKARLLELNAGGLSYAALQKTLRRQLGSALTHDLIQNCADWRGDKADVSDPEQLAVIEAALGAQLAHLIPCEASVGTTGAGAQLYRWLIPSIGGGLLGFFLLGPDGSGGALGALIGAPSGVAGVAWLVNHPEALSQPGRAEGSDGERTISFPRIAWLQDPGRWLLRNAQALARRMAARLVALVVPPPPLAVATLSNSTISPICERAFDLLTTLVFIHCTALTAGGASASREDPDLPITESSVLRALLALTRALDRKPTDTETVLDLAEELHQRMEDDGYLYEELPDGTPFQEKHRQHFHTLGLIEPGEPVETQEPCFRRSEVVLLPGRITKKRG